MLSFVLALVPGLGRAAPAAAVLGLSTRAVGGLCVVVAVPMVRARVERLRSQPPGR